MLPERERHHRWRPIPALLMALVAGLLTLLATRYEPLSSWVRKTAVPSIGLDRPP